MSRINGFEEIDDTPGKVLELYRAVEEMILEDIDINTVKVSAIAERAGIGKGTVYDYFDTKEELLACAVVFYLRKIGSEIRKMINEGKSFQDRINILLEAILQENGHPQCLLMRYIHISMDRSDYSRIIREKTKQREMTHYLPAGIVRDMVYEAKNNSEIRKDCPTTFAVYAIISKLITFMAMVGNSENNDISNLDIRNLIYNEMLMELCPN